MTAQPMPPAPAPKKKRTVLWVILIVLVAMIGGCIAIMGSAAKKVDESLKAEHKIIYKVTANGKAHVAYGSTSGSSSADITEDWTKEVTVTGWDAVSLIVTNGDFQNADLKISCEIIVDGKSQAKNESSGASAMATCSASSIK